MITIIYIFQILVSNWKKSLGPSICVKLSAQTYCKNSCKISKKHINLHSQIYSSQLNITKESTSIKFGLYLLNFRLIFWFGLYFCINKPPLFNNMSYSGYTVMKNVFRDVFKIFCFFFLLWGSNLLLFSVFFCDFFWFSTIRGRQLCI